METGEVDADSDSLSPGASLPRFLKPVQSTQCSATQVSVPVHAVYTHKHPFGNAHVLWWPTQTRRVCDNAGGSKTVPTPRTILLFIPGTFCSLVRAAEVTHTLALFERARTKTKNKICCLLLRFACVCVSLCVRVFHRTSLSFRKPWIARLLCAIFRRDLS